MDEELNYQKKIEILLDTLDTKIPDFRKKCVGTLVVLYHKIKYKNSLDAETLNTKKLEAKKELSECNNRDFALCLVDNLDYLEGFIQYLSVYDDGEECKDLLKILKDYRVIALSNLAVTWAINVNDYGRINKNDKVSTAIEKLLDNSVLIVLDAPILSIVTASDIHSKSQNPTEGIISDVMNSSITAFDETTQMQTIHDYIWLGTIEYDQVIITRKGAFLGIISKAETLAWMLKKSSYNIH